MDRNYILTLSGETYSVFDGKSTPFQLILAETQISLVSTAQLPGANLFITVAFRGSARIVAILKIESVLQFDDRYGPAGFLLEADKTRSFRVCRVSEADSAPELGGEVYGDNLVHSLPDSEAENLLNLLRQSSSISLVGSERAIKDTVNSDVSFGKKPLSIARELIHSIVQRVPFMEAKKIPADKDLSPFVSLACQCAREKMPEPKLTSILAEIVRLDPLRVAGHAKDKQVEREVDTFFTPLDPNTVRPRRIISTVKPTDPEEQSRKTQLAEIRHQEIVKDLAERILFLGFVPLESRSIDLAVRRGDVLIIFEVKSANADNASSQMEKGIIQIIRYSTVIDDEEANHCEASLVMEECFDSGEYNQGAKMLRRLGYVVQVYHGTKPWPERMPGLEGFLRQVRE